jgi:amidase
LGKANLSEWANFLCDGCPNGYSAIGGQTLNPYGPRTFDTGGSSSGSAVSVAANYAVAAIGTETSGSILSPSSQQSSVGLKPTVGVLSQEGIVPISSTLDTPGPITKTISDNSIVFSAMASAKSGAAVPWEIDPRADLKNLRFGVYTSYLEDSLYSRALEDLKTLGAELIEINPKPMNFEGFTELLSGDMKIDLANYLKAYTSEDVIVKSAADVIKFNLEDTLVRIPYGQARFEGIEDLNLSEEELQDIRDNLYKAGLAYFETPMVDNRLDAMLSINNYNAGQAAAAKYPGLTVPMGYTSEGEPKGLTFIAKPYGESDLFSYAKLFEQNTNYRESPKKYSN